MFGQELLLIQHYHYNINARASVRFRIGPGLHEFRHVRHLRNDTNETGRSRPNSFLFSPYDVGNNIIILLFCVHARSSSVCAYYGAHFILSSNPLQHASIISYSDNNIIIFDRVRISPAGPSNCSWACRVNAIPAK